MKQTKNLLTDKQEKAFLTVIEYLMNLEPDPKSQLGITLNTLTDLEHKHEDQKYTTDYQKFTTKNMPIEERRKLDVGDIWSNTVECPYCHEMIRSRNRHDHVTCKCGKTFVDGGSWYTRSTTEAINKTELYDVVE